MQSSVKFLVYFVGTILFKDRMCILPALRYITTSCRSSNANISQLNVNTRVLRRNIESKTIAHSIIEGKKTVSVAILNFLMTPVSRASGSP